MADFCKDCSIEMFGKDYGDLAELCEEGETILTLCETCGWIKVDHTGKKIKEERKHAKITATCGHEVTFENEVICSLKAMTPNGRPAVSTEVLCQQCYDEVLKLGYVLETDFEIYSYLAGEMEIKNK